MVAKLYGHSIVDTTEGRGVHFPVLNRIVKETDAIIESPLHTEAFRTKVIRLNMADVVRVKIDHLF